MTRKYLKLMAEYGYHTLWDEYGAVNQEKIPLSPETKHRLFAWASIYHERLNWQDPAATAPWSQEHLQAFEEEGRALWEQLRTPYHVLCKRSLCEMTQSAPFLGSEDSRMSHYTKFGMVSN